MILTDYLLSEKSVQWELAKQCGVNHAVVRLPETTEFDVTNASHWESVYKKFTDFGLTPLVVEPLPNCLHDHIKAGDEKRDECVEKAMKMIPIMAKLKMNVLCFNFMAHIGWLRTSSEIVERGGALVTGFDLKDFEPTEKAITKEELWANYTYFIKAMVPVCEKYGVKLALHPDDPPIDRLGNVERIMTSAENFERAMKIGESDALGVTFCQATFHMMGEDMYSLIPRWKDKIFFVHFRNAVGNKTAFCETFHDNGALDMTKLMKSYRDCGIDVPVRVDHVPTMASDLNSVPGYSTTGRLFAIGYLKGILDGIGGNYV